MKTALVTGITGQDGSYLAELLLEKDYKVVGMKRRSSTANLDRLGKSINHPNFTIVEGEVADSGCIYALVDDIQPAEIYNLAAQSHVGTSFDQPDHTFQVNAMGPLYFLEAIRRFSPDSRFYQASTSEMFGKNFTEENGKKHQCEKTPFAPQSPYAISKVNAHHTVRIYREAYGIFGCCGILFNHESERRGENFVTRKITKWIGEFSVWLNRHGVMASELNFDDDDHVYIPSRRIDQIAHTRFPKLRLGNLDAYRDWGHARDYVKAMWLMMQHDEPDDFIVATGESHSIRDFLNEAFSYIEGADDWENYVTIDPKFYRPAEVDYLRGSLQKAKDTLGWEPDTEFEDLVKLMVDHDINATQKLG
jgi:GDPmannose 4,6-dehydratase